MSEETYPSAENSGINLRVGLTLSPHCEREIDSILNRLAQRLPAQFVLLADTSGLVITFFGDRKSEDLVSISSLIAGDIAASQEIARLTGQYGSHQLILREGSKTNSFIAEAGEFLVLFVQISVEIPLGWSRLLIREVCSQIEELVKNEPQTPRKVDLTSEEGDIKEAVTKALDSLWSD